MLGKCPQSKPEERTDPTLCFWTKNSARVTAGSGFSGSSKGVAGTADATSNATAEGSGQASAQATVFSGASAGAATATSTSGEGAGRSVSASGVAPVGGNASAQTISSFGGSGFGLPGISAGISISNVTGGPNGYSLTPNVSAAFGHRPVDALGAMSIAYGGHGESLTYQTSATFQFGKRPVKDASQFAIKCENVCTITGKLMGTHVDGYGSAWS